MEDTFGSPKLPPIVMPGPTDDYKKQFQNFDSSNNSSWSEDSSTSKMANNHLFDKSESEVELKNADTQTRPEDLITSPKD